MSPKFRQVGPLEDMLSESSANANSSQNNGGIVVRMEAQADVLVADHLRIRDAPEGSVSYKYIDACIANGELVDMEAHRIAAASTARPAGSSRSAKTTRAPFTEFEKRILVTWVRRCESAGERILGNAIYHTLAENVRNPAKPRLIPTRLADRLQYPSHTWQSWRTKWIELSRLPEASLPAVLPEMPSLARPTATAPPPATAAVAAPRAAPPAKQPAVSRPAGEGRVFFTPEDDQILRDYVRGQPFPKGNKIYVTLHEMVRRHPGTSLLCCFVS